MPTSKAYHQLVTAMIRRSLARRGTGASGGGGGGGGGGGDFHPPCFLLADFAPVGQILAVGVEARRRRAVVEGAVERMVLDGIVKKPFLKPTGNGWVAIWLDQECDLSAWILREENPKWIRDLRESFPLTKDVAAAIADMEAYFTKNSLTTGDVGKEGARLAGGKQDADGGVKNGGQQISLTSYGFGVSKPNLSGELIRKESTHGKVGDKDLSNDENSLIDKSLSALSSHNYGRLEQKLSALRAQLESQIASFDDLKSKHEALDDGFAAIEKLTNNHASHDEALKSLTGKYRFDIPRLEDAIERYHDNFHDIVTPMRTTQSKLIKRVHTLVNMSKAQADTLTTLKTKIDDDMSDRLKLLERQNFALETRMIAYQTQITNLKQQIHMDAETERERDLAAETAIMDLKRKHYENISELQNTNNAILRDMTNRIAALERKVESASVTPPATPVPEAIVSHVENVVSKKRKRKHSNGDGESPKRRHKRVIKEFKAKSA